MHVAQRVVGLGVEGAFAVYATARALEAQGRDVIHLEIGEPDFETPAHIVDAGVRALRDGMTHYTQSSGIPELRDAIATSAGERGIRASAENVIVTPGSKQVLFMTMQALIEPGDEVLIPDPAYPGYESSVTVAGGRAVPYVLADLASLVTPRTRAIVINSPQNPTGEVLSHDALEAVGELAIRHDLFVITDEIYHKLSYCEASPRSIASFPGMRERTVVIDGFSKAYAMTGWRLGYGILPDPVAGAVGKLVNNSNACVAPFVQVAGIAALTGPQDCVRSMRDEFRQRRDIIVAALNAMPGVTCANPSGAFYAFPRVEGDAHALSERLLHDHGVACLAGTAFGANGAGHLRFSFVRSADVIREAMRRVAGAL